MPFFTFLGAALVVAMVSALWDNLSVRPQRPFAWGRFLQLCLFGAINFAAGVAWYRGWRAFW